MFLSAPDSDLLEVMQEAHQLIEGCPSVVQLVEADLDAHALRKKFLRVADAAWERARTDCLPGVAVPDIPVDPANLTLEQGRARTPAYVVLMAILLRGYFGAGFKACGVTTMMAESMTLEVFFGNLGMRMPKRSTLTELVNAVTNQTRERILDAQVAQALRLGWDDFSVMLQDSTHVEGNSAWPTDSRTIVALVNRILRVGTKLTKVELPVIDCPKAERHATVMRELAREIDMASGSGEKPRARRRRYEKLLRRGKRVHGLLTEAVAQVEAAAALLDVRPSRKEMAERTAARLRGDVDALAKVLEHCEARVVHGAKVPMAEKVLGVADPDVGFIAKGQREPVIGYKPQLARSGEGFITGLLLPRGNAADAPQLVPMLDEVVRRTGVVPKVVSVDDGYASRANMQAMQNEHIEVTSINGAKGRALTAPADWESDEYAEARDIRSAIESLMFILKQGFGFDAVARRGLQAVHGELLEKALAYNLCQGARIRRRAERAGLDLVRERELAAA